MSLLRLVFLQANNGGNWFIPGGGNFGSVRNAIEEVTLKCGNDFHFGNFFVWVCVVRYTYIQSNHRALSFGPCS